MIHATVYAMDTETSRPSFLSGIARLLDLWGVYDDHNQICDPRESDARALYSDWRMTGEDLYGVMMGDGQRGL